MRWEELKAWARSILLTRPGGLKGLLARTSARSRFLNAQFE
jgi:hypothetical protein